MLPRLGDRPSGGRTEMPLRVKIFRGLVMEAEEDINKYLMTNQVRVLQLAQSESGNQISVTMLVDEPEPLPDYGL